jgi:hypothetical protein
MVRFVSAISAALMLFAPLAAAAQQQFTIDPTLLQQLTQVQATSSVSYQLQQRILQFLPIAQTYLQDLNAGNGDTEAIVQRLETMLTNPKFFLAAQGIASTTIQALSTGSTTNQALINTLLGQVATLQQQIDLIVKSQAASTTVSAPVIPPAPVPAGASTTAQIVCPVITRLLQIGANGTDVINLQVFLAAEGFFDMANATGYFGKLTEAAVQAWQNAKAIVTAGDPATTGFGAVGPKTRAALLNCR